MIEVIARNNAAFCMLALIASRAWRGPSIDRHGCRAGEAFIGDYAQWGLTPKGYRVAKKQLEEFGLCSFRTTNRGTIAKLLTRDIFDLGAISDRNAAA
jgi:hypothetical protein